MLETQYADVVSLIKNAEWVQSVIKQLADFLLRNEPDLNGFLDRNLWGKKQFMKVIKITQNSQRC